MSLRCSQIKAQRRYNKTRVRKCTESQREASKRYYNSDRGKEIRERNLKGNIEKDLASFSKEVNKLYDKIMGKRDE